MRFHAALSQATHLERALPEVVTDLERGLDGEPDLLFAFASPHHRPHYGELARRLRDCFPKATLLGCSAGGVLAGGRELEGRVGLSLLGARLPGVDLWLHHFDNPPAHMRSADALVVLASPFGSAPRALLRGLDVCLPGVPKVGGIASGAQEVEGIGLFHNEACHQRGALVLGLSGDVHMEPMIAQGCRPIGAPLFVTRAQGNVIHSLDGHPAGEVLQALLAELDAEDRTLARRSLFIGLATRQGEQRYGPGDFLVRNLLGLDPERGALVIGAPVFEQSVVQFHLRDASSASRDLRNLLEGADAEPPAGALLCACLGRGLGLYGEPDHDSRLFAERFASTPLGGFFGNGELGPVGERTYLHGYTSAFALFRSGS